MKKILYGMMSLLLLGILATGAFAISYDAEGSRTSKNGFKGGNGLQDGTGTHNADGMKGMGRNRHSENKVMCDGVEEALESHDYDLWKESVSENNRFLTAVTEEKFDLFVEMYEARENEDFQRVQEIRAELGFERGGRGRMMK